MKIKIGFVILHYMAYEQTKKCVESIFTNIDTDSYFIVIVDNNSTNDSLDKLQEIYCENEKIKIIHNDENLGFAKGNNIGISFIRNNFISEFICCLNNDVYIIDKRFTITLTHEYRNSEFAVCGPLIFTSDGRYDSSPQNYILLNTQDDVKEDIKRCKKMILLNKIHFYNFYIFLRFIKNRIKKKNNRKIIVKREENIQLSGSCLIFSKLYFEYYNGFYNETFLYKEEDILRYLLRKKNLLSVFLPDIVVYHEEDAATDMVLSNGRKKNIFLYTEYIKSLDILLDLMNDCN